MIFSRRRLILPGLADFQDREFLVKHNALPHERIRAVETGTSSLTKLTQAPVLTPRSVKTSLQTCMSWKIYIVSSTLKSS